MGFESLFQEKRTTIPPPTKQKQEQFEHSFKTKDHEGRLPEKEPNSDKTGETQKANGCFYAGMRDILTCNVHNLFT